MAIMALRVFPDDIISIINHVVDTFIFIHILLVCKQQQEQEKQHKTVTICDI